MAHTEERVSNSCLNCGEQVNGKYCSNCGQKFQPTVLPMKEFLEDALEGFFNIDNRLLKTVKELFIHPGRVTNNYLRGERIKYVSPIKIYIWISVFYFVLVTVIDTNRFFLINFNDIDAGKSFGSVLQYIMFFLLPVFAAIVALTYRKKKKLYVEFLIFSIHIHAVWYTISTIYILSEYFLNQLSVNIYGEVFFNIVLALSRAGILIYLFLYLKNVYQESFIITFIKTWVIITLYSMVLLAIVITYTNFT